MRQVTTRFHEIVLAVDPFPGPFTRQHAAGDLDALMAIAMELETLGVVDRVIVFPADSESTRAINQRWTGSTAAVIARQRTSLWPPSSGPSIRLLQCNLDVLIGQRQPNHDVVGDMLDACRTEMGFNIPYDPSAAPRPYAGESGQFAPEVRCDLLDLQCIHSCLPLPNLIMNGRPTTTWYRSLQQFQRE